MLVCSTILLIENYYQFSEMQNMLLYSKYNAILIHKKTYANRFVQVKNILYMHAFEVKVALNKCPEDNL